MQKNVTIIILIVLLILSNAVLLLLNESKKSDLSLLKKEISVLKQNKKVFDFQKLFISKVLMENGDVDFNARVELQNAVMATNEEKIIKAWSDFLAVKTENEGQIKLKELLLILTDKIYSK